MQLGLRIFISFMLVSMIPASPLSADAWGTGSADTGAHPDGSSHNWCWGSGFDFALQDNVNSSMYYALDSPTEASVEFKANCKMSGDGETDVVWFDANLPSGTRGMAFCEDYDGDVCDQYYVSLDPDEINIGTEDEADTTKTSCHELGHTVGLTHGSGGGDGTVDDCLYSGERPNNNIQYERYSTHHKGHINDWF